MGLAGVWGLSSLFACGPEPAKLPDKEELRLPTASRVDPSGRWLFVTQGNWDRLDDYSLLSGYDLAPINARWDDPNQVGCVPSQSPGRGPTCDLTPFALPNATRYLPSGAGNIALDRPPQVPDGRLLIPTRHRSALVWLDLLARPDGLFVECGQGQGSACQGAHILDAVQAEPSRIYLDEQGFDFAYLPHLSEKRLSLLSLRGPKGPSLVHQSDQFYGPTTIGEREFAGGLGLAQLPCDAATDYVPRASRDCSRPLLYGAQRFVYGFRPFTVAPGREVILSGVALELQGHAEQDAAATGWPTMGGMWVHAATRQLFAVQHRPPMLLRISLELDAQKNPTNRLVDALPLCERADLMQAFDGPQGKTRLALSCPGRAELLIVDPVQMRLVARVKVGQGANELYYEAPKKRLWVTNTLEHSISVVDVDPQSPRYLREGLRLQSSAPGATK